MKTHVLKEKDILEFCFYCSCSMKDKKWESVFCYDSHYKTTECKCGKTHRIKVEFSGSGHDDFGLESKIK